MLAVAILLALTPLPNLDPPPPPLSDLVRFPDAKAANDHVQTLCRQYCRLHMQPKSAERDAAIRQIRHARQCWSALRSAHGVDEGIVNDRTRRQALEELRLLIGDRDYQRGRMP